MSQDSQLQEAVLAELRWEPSVVAGHIGVSARAGVVTLTGHVESFMQKLAAEAATRRVKDVKAVAEELEVKLPYDMRRDDTDIASASVERLAWDVSVPKNRIAVQVEKGWVTLTGEVDWHYQKDAAAQDIHHLLGVVGVSNQIGINPLIDTSNVSDDIMHALHRSWFFDPKTVNVTADGGRIRLTGTVHSWHDRQVAAETAWAAPGATAVENDLTVL
jgi:osmotically-inducible protein OsmY